MALVTTGLVALTVAAPTTYSTAASKNSEVIVALLSCLQSTYGPCWWKSLHRSSGAKLCLPACEVCLTRAPSKTSTDVKQTPRLLRVLSSMARYHSPNPARSHHPQVLSLACSSTLVGSEASQPQAQSGLARSTTPTPPSLSVSRWAFLLVPQDADQCAESASVQV